MQLQADNPNIELRMPTEGCILWSDNMVIPVGAPNPTAARGVHELRLRPEEPGPIAAYDNYVTPVDGVRESFQKSNPDARERPADLPDGVSSPATAPTQPNLTGQEEQNVTGRSRTSSTAEARALTAGDGRR